MTKKKLKKDKINDNLFLTGIKYNLNTAVILIISFIALLIIFNVFFPQSKNISTSVINTEQVKNYQEIHMNVTASGWQPNHFSLKVGVPVKWVINGQQLTGCNSGIKVPSLGLSFNIKSGEQIINFTPTQTGNIPWSCWMGMIKGTFNVN